MTAVRSALSYHLQFCSPNLYTASNCNICVESVRSFALTFVVSEVNLLFEASFRPNLPSLLLVLSRARGSSAICCFCHSVLSGRSNAGLTITIAELSDLAPAKSCKVLINQAIIHVLALGTMGPGDYPKAGPPVGSANSPQAAHISERPIPAYLSQDPSLMGNSRYNPVLASSRSSIAPSVRSTQSGFLDDIKHEVMVNYLYQQQCSRLWVSDGSGECEGVLLRRSRGQYLTCPPQLLASVLALVCAELNLQVSKCETRAGSKIDRNRLP